jgi:hypothetical protein
MGTQLATIEPIQPLDVRRPARLSSLPRWVAERLAVVRNEPQADRTGKHRVTPVLPACLILSQDQKMLIEQHVRAMDTVLAMTPEADGRHGEATMVAVSKMLLVLPSRESGDLGGEAKGEAFMDALEDVPFWAVQEAMRKWHRGEHGSKHDYKWQPAPAVLRDLAMVETYQVMGTRRRLKELLIAEPLVEFTDAYRAEMREKLTAVVRGVLSVNKKTSDDEAAA